MNTRAIQYCLNAPDNKHTRNKIKIQADRATIPSSIFYIKNQNQQTVLDSVSLSLFSILLLWKWDSSA